ncbi:hypothetical protein J6590_108236 [Homalodisca vitripennis]|nr:hypothetical protein J6590_108236 [Homalodisca vitripennis]
MEIKCNCLLEVAPKETPAVKMVRNISVNSILYFKFCLSEMNWLELLKCKTMTAETMFDQFFNKFLEIFNDCCPLKCVKAKAHTVKKRSIKSHLAWYTPELEILRKRVMGYRTVFKTTGSEQALRAYKEIRCRYRKSVNQAKLVANVNFIESASNPCQAAWSLIKKKTSPAVNETTNISADEFNNFFIESVHAIKAAESQPVATSSHFLRNIVQPQQQLHWETVSEKNLLCTVNKMKCTKSKDVYGLSSYILKMVISEIMLPLMLCINACLKEGVFPTSQKVSRVVPVFKKNDRNQVCNYRPVSLVPCIGKIIEHVVHRQLCTFLSENDIFSNSQFGFRKNRSTVDALESLISKMLQAFEDRRLAQITACDLSKAFDCIDHQILLEKLNYYGVCGHQLDFFKSYLLGRSQYVDNGKDQSKKVEVNEGVPQGSILGPTLFLLIMNDLPNNISRSFTAMFADDTTFLSVDSDVNSLSLVVENTMKQAVDWFAANSLTLNQGKTQNLLCSLKNSVSLGHIESITEIKILGIIVDNKLTWTPQIESMCTKLAKVIYLLKSLSSMLPLQYLRIVYFAFFHSVICYGVLLWGNSSHVNNILLLQKKAIRIVTKSLVKAHCKPLFVDSRILTVINLYIFVCVVNVKNNSNLVSVHSDVHNHDTRNQSKAVIPLCRLSKSTNSYNVVGLKLYNKLHIASKSLPLSLFKVRFHKWLIANPFYDLKDFLKFDNIII